MRHMRAYVSVLWLCSYTCMHDWSFLYIIQFAFANIVASVYRVDPIQYHKVMFWIWNSVKGYFSNLFWSPCMLSDIAFMVVFDSHLINYLAFILSCAFLSALLVIFQLWWWHEGCFANVCGEQWCQTSSDYNAMYLYYRSCTPARSNCSGVVAVV